MNKRVLWIGELFLWLILISVSVVLFVFVRSIDAQKTSSYYLFFNDVDGLTRGSPVRLMGMQIGFVQDIKVFDNSVFVSFLVTKENVKVPEKATACVEFYGLGGSKSLEIVPGDKDSLDGERQDRKEELLIITKEPYRIQDFFDYQARIAHTIIKIGDGFTSTLEENQIYKARRDLKVSSNIKKIDSNIKKTNEVDLKAADETIKKIDSKVFNSHKFLNE